MKHARVHLPCGLLGLLVTLVGLGGCGGCEDPSSQAPASTASAAIVAPATTAKSKLDGCPNAVQGAGTSISNTNGGVTLSITAADAAALAEVRSRAKALLEDAKKTTADDHTGEGTGGGRGHCPVVLRGTTIDLQDIEGGVAIHVRATNEDEVDWLRRESRDRLAALEKSTENKPKRVELCPTSVRGAKSSVTRREGAVEVVVTAESPDAVSDIRSRAAKLPAAAKQRAEGQGGHGGGLGRCVIVVDDTTIETREVEGGALFMVRPLKADGLDALAKEIEARARR